MSAVLSLAFLCDGSCERESLLLGSVTFIDIYCVAYKVLMVKGLCSQKNQILTYLLAIVDN